MIFILPSSLKSDLRLQFIVGEFSGLGQLLHFPNRLPQKPEIVDQKFFEGSCLPFQDLLHRRRDLIGVSVLADLEQLQQNSNHPWGHSSPFHVFGCVRVFVGKRAVEKAAPWKVQRRDFPTPLGNSAKAAEFPLFPPLRPRRVNFSYFNSWKTE